MLHVALIGLGPDWQLRYAAAINSLQRRLRVRGLYSAMGAVAEEASQELACAPSSGILPLISRPSIRGVLMLDVGMCSLYPLELAVRYGKPIFLGHETLHQVCNHPEFRQRIGDTSLIMPSREWRYHPSTARLRELMATKLGRPREIHISVTPAADRPVASHPEKPAEKSDVRLDDLIDWCRFLFGTGLESIQAVAAPGTDGRQSIHLDFLPPASGVLPPPRAMLECQVDPTGSGWFHPDVSLRMEVQCQRGKAVISGPRDIAWEDASSAKTESLSSDRSAIEVMLDHFARRAVGGLIPVPNLEDVFFAREQVARAEESLRMRRPLSA